MTDEEIDRMADNFVNAQEFTKVYGFARKAECGAFWKYGFLAGLKAGRPQWHDLRKDPNDLPPKMLSNSNFSIDVLSDKGEIVCYNFHYCEWFYWRSGSPIAWCEIPTFDKE